MPRQREHALAEDIVEREWHEDPPGSTISRGTIAAPTPAPTSERTVSLSSERMITFSS